MMDEFAQIYETLTVDHYIIKDEGGRMQSRKIHPSAFILHPFPTKPFQNLYVKEIG
jgi:hypothetical protein